MSSRFFASFSLPDLLGDRFSSLSSPGRRASGGIGSGGGSAGFGHSRYNRTESHSYSVHNSSDGEFDEAELIESLKASVEQEVLKNGASIHTRGDIPGNFNSSEFFLEYRQGGIQGRILISGDLTGSMYRLRADIEEKSEGEGPSFPMDAFSKIRPEGDYYVVALAPGDPLAQNDKLHHIGTELIKESSKRIPNAEVWTLFSMPPHVKELFQQRGFEQRVQVPEEYQEYAKVCFLNDVALGMYKEGGIVLKVLKKVTGAEMPAGCGRTLRGPYISK